MKAQEAKPKLYEDVWEVIRREEEELGSFPQVDITALVAESGRAYRAEYVRKHSPVTDEDPAWAEEMKALLWKVALKTRNPVREAVAVGLLAALPLLPCIAISYYLLRGGTQSRLGLWTLYLTAGVCLLMTVALLIQLRRRVVRLGIMRFNVTFNSKTFWGFFSNTGGGLLAGSMASVLVAALTPQLLKNVARHRAQAAQGSIQQFRDAAKSNEEAALELAEVEALTSIRQFHDTVSPSAIAEGETKVVRENKTLSVKTTKLAPKVVKRDISAGSPDESITVSTQASPFEASVYSTTSGGHPVLLTKFLVGKVDEVRGDRVTVKVSGRDDMVHTRELSYDLIKLGRPVIGQKKVFVIDATTGSIKAFKELPSEPSHRGAQLNSPEPVPPPPSASVTESQADPTPHKSN